jgi:hypothetical protein
LTAAATQYLRAGLIERKGPAVGTVGGHGVERVGDGEDARTEWDSLAALATRIAGAVEGLLMGIDDL